MVMRKDRAARRRGKPSGVLTTEVILVRRGFGNAERGTLTLDEHGWLTYKGELHSRNFAAGTDDVVLLDEPHGCLWWFSGSTQLRLSVHRGEYRFTFPPRGRYDIGRAAAEAARWRSVIAQTQSVADPK